MPEAPTRRHGPLTDLLVVQLGDRTATVHCGALLAQLGAEVIVVEQTPHRPGRVRTVVGRSSIRLDHSIDSDRAQLAQLLAVADVVLLCTTESAWAADIWDGPRSARQIVCDITAFGHSGPLAGQAYSDALIQAVSGCAWITGDPDGAPTLTGAPLLEMETAVYAAAAITAAARVRRLHGFGQRIDMAVYDVAINALAVWIPLALSGAEVRREGNRHPILSPWNVYPTRDGWLALCAPSDDQWRRLCTLMGSPELSDDPRFASSAARVSHAAEVDAIIGSWSGGRGLPACLEELTAAGLPNGPILSLADVPDEPNLVHRSMIQQATDPETGTDVVLPGPVLRLADGWQTRAPAADGDRLRVRHLITQRRPAAATDLVTGAGPVHADIRPLDGVRVIEIGMNTVAPLAGRQLGALGADVIKIEPPRGDVNRHNGPFRDDGQSYIFAISNTDKRGLVLDLRDSEHLATLHDLLSSADVLLENLKPGSLTRLGLGPETVRARWPHLIYCSANGFGHDSVYPGRPALDTVIQAMSGVMSSTPVHGVPTKAGISVADQLGGQFALLAILAGLELREQTGTGSTIDIAMLDAAAWATQDLWSGPATPPDARIVEAGAEWIAEQAATGVQARVASVAAALRAPQTTARRLVVERPTMLGDRWPVLGSPLRLESTPAVVRSAMPALGVIDRRLSDEIGRAAPRTRQDKRVDRGVPA